MEITFDTILSILGLFIGGGGGAFFTWRYMRRKAKAEAQTEEVNMAKAVQDAYQQMLADKETDLEDRKKVIQELREERDHYKNERNEYRDMLAQRDEEFRKFRRQCEEELDTLKRTQARQGRQIEAMRPFMCGDLRCPSRQRVTTLDAEALERTVHINEEQKEIDPYNGD